MLRVTIQLNPIKMYSNSARRISNITKQMASLLDCVWRYNVEFMLTLSIGTGERRKPNVGHCEAKKIPSP